MRNLLLSTSALLAFGIGSGASAAEWDTRVSGFYFLGQTVTDAPDQDGVGILRDGEFHVNARLVADNGITFRARIEVEAFTSDDQIDENWGSVSGSFGTILIGSNDDAVYSNHVGTIFAPGTRVGYYDAFGVTSQGIAAAPLPGNGSDQISIQYTTPNFFGFKAYGSYHPSSNSDGAADTNNPVFQSQDFYTVGASYNRNLQGIGLAFSAGYTDLPGQELITLGTTLSYEAFSFAGAYENNIEAGDNRGEFALGAQYANGLWTVGGGFSHEESVGEQAAGWITYAVAPGVQATTGVEYGDATGVPGSDIGGIGYLTFRF